jgi:hypothetical protein
MSLLSTRPKLSDVCTAILGHAVTGDKLTNCFASASIDKFDSAYVGSKDRLSNFGMYGTPTASVSHAGLSWAWNSISVQSFFVTCNHSTWKFYSGNDATGWTISIYDSTNTTYLGTYDTTTLWQSGVTIRVCPNASNTSGSEKYCILYITTYNDYIIFGAECDCQQDYQIIPPSITLTVGGMSVTGWSYSITAGSYSVTINWTPLSMPTSPHLNYIYMSKPGPVSVYSGTKSNCRNSVATNLTFTMSEVAQNNINYLIDIEYDNA